jgi:anti-sigma factor (TIGR02949 family)
MRCAEVGRLVDRYVDGQLTAGRRAGLERHAETCAACRQQIEAARRIGRMLASDAAAIRAPRGLADRVMDRVHRETLWRPAGSGAVVAQAAGVPARGYRRLGRCVMLGAAALVACLVVPRAVLPTAAGPWAAGDGSALVKSVLDGVDGAVRGALSAAGGSAARIVEGGSR